MSAADLDAGLAEIRRALIDADVATPVADALITRVRTDVLAQDLVGGLGVGERLLATVHQIGRAHV